MTVIRHITLDANNPYELGKFWEAVLGWPIDPDCAPGDGEVLLQAPEGLPGLLLIEVPERKSAKSRMHFDLQPGTTRDEELARVLDLGAKVFEDHRTADGAGWVWCEDPEGNAGGYIPRTALPTCGNDPPDRESRHDQHHSYTYPPEADYSHDRSAAPHRPARRGRGSHLEVHRGIRLR